MALADMQQRNVTAAEAAAAHAEDPLTATFLEPTESKAQCADNYAAGYAPVNPALTKARQFIAGIRGAIFGDFTGAVQRSLKSLFVEPNGGTPHSETPGTVLIFGTGANNVVAFRLVTGRLRVGGDIISDLGNVVVQMGSVFTNAGNFQTQSGNFVSDSSSSYVNMGTTGERSFLTSRLVRFVGTTTLTTGSNPPQGTVIKNELRAINTPKCEAYIKIVAGVVTGYPGYGIGNVEIDTVLPYMINITFAANFVNTDYTVRGGAVDMTGSTANPYEPVENISARAVNSCQVYLQNIKTPGPLIINSGVTISFSIEINGQQST